MSDFISYLDHQFQQAQLAMQMGRKVDARHRFDRLLSYGDVPSWMREESHRLLAQIHLQAQRYRKARRHLLAALALDGANPENHYRMALAIDADPEGNPLRAWKHLRKAVQLNSEEARYWSALGQLSLRINEWKWARRAFRKATDLLPDRIAVIDEIVDGFLAMDQEDEAERVLLMARFRMPKNVALQELWNSFRFGQTVRSQRKAHIFRNQEPVLLAFQPRPISKPHTPPTEGGILRHDRFSRAVGHLLRFIPRQADPRR